MSSLKIRSGAEKDADVLRRVFEYASHGLSSYLWAKGLDPEKNYDQFVAARMIEKIRDPDQSFRVAEIDGKPVGGIVTYRISELRPLKDVSELERSFNEVDNGLLGSVYINAIAVFPSFRRNGIASALLQDAQADAARNSEPTSLSVSDANPGAIATYEANGYRNVGKVRMVKEDWPGEGENWLLMINDNASPCHNPEKTFGASPQRPL